MAEQKEVITKAKSRALIGVSKVFVLIEKAMYRMLLATCGPSVCGIYFNTNLTNLSNCAGLTFNKETIRFVFL